MPGRYIVNIRSDGTVESAVVPAFVNCWKDIDGGTGGTADVSVATTGNLLAVFLATSTSADADDATVTSDIDGAFTKIISIRDVGYPRAAWFYLENATSGAHTLTYYGGANSNYTNIFIYEISGVSTTAPFTGGEYTTKFQAASTNPFTGNLTNGTANSFFLAGFVSNIAISESIDINGSNTVPAGSWSEHANSEQEDGSSVMHSGTAYYLASSSSARAHGWTIGDSSVSSSIIVCFHP